MIIRKKNKGVITKQVKISQTRIFIFDFEQNTRHKLHVRVLVKNRVKTPRSSRSEQFMFYFNYDECFLIALLASCSN